MIIAEKFVVEKDMYSWTLNYNYMGKDKDGQPKQHSKQTYHVNLRQVANAIVNYSAKECKTMEQLVALLDNAESIVHECLLRMEAKAKKETVDA